MAGVRKKRKLTLDLPLVVATVVRPVATRLDNIEGLLVEMRGALDYHLKRIDALQGQVDILIAASVRRAARVKPNRKR